MEKIRLGKTNMLVSRIGFGGIPIQRASEEEAVNVVRQSLNMGMNYIDTAYMYTTSEGRIGKAIARRRQKPFIATKTGADIKEIKPHLKHSLETLGVDAIDLYQFHNVSDMKTLESILAPKGALSILKEAKKGGQIKHIGVTSHQIDVAKAAVKSGQFETIMYPFNFISCEAETELLPLVRKYDMGFIAMKPFAGGRIRNISLALKYLLQFPDVLPIPGIGKVGEAKQIVEVLKAPQMTPQDEREIERTRQKMSDRICRHCDYCMPCPQGIAVSYVLDFEPLSMAFSDDFFYTGGMASAMAVAAKCDNCGKCVKRCPYHIPVNEMLAEYVKKYDEGKKGYLKKQTAASAGRKSAKR
jgi:predicted aldo/keto reductase-like oxidoreductase